MCVGLYRREYSLQPNGSYCNVELRFFFLLGPVTFISSWLTFPALLSFMRVSSTHQKKSWTMTGRKVQRKQQLNSEICCEFTRYSLPNVVWLILAALQQNRKQILL